MAKPRQNTQQPDDPTPPEFPDSDIPPDEGGDIDPSDALAALDFDVEDEYKPEPLIPSSKYYGVVNKVSFVPAQYSIVWDICLHDNGGVMTDGYTPIDGAHVYFRNWLPKPGDEKEMTKKGNSTKRQSKINMLQDFQSKLGLDMSTPSKIATALNEHQWIGIEVEAEVDVDEYQGRFRNTVNRIHRSSAF
jgi:hypothetical protein